MLDAIFFVLMIAVAIALLKFEFQGRKIGTEEFFTVTDKESIYKIRVVITEDGSYWPPYMKKFGRPMCFTDTQKCQEYLEEQIRGHETDDLMAILIENRVIEIRPIDAGGGMK